MSRIARRYAKALFNLTSSDLSKAKRDRQALLDIDQLFELPESQRVLCSPIMPIELKRELLSYALIQAQAADEVKNLVHAVLDGGRVEFLPKIAQAYSEYIDEAEGIARADLISAVPLPPEDSQKIAAALGQLLHKKIEFRPLTDSSVLGGFVAQVGHYLVDLSLKTRLSGLASSAVQDTIR